MCAAKKANRSRLIKSAERYTSKLAYKKAAAAYREVLALDAGDLHTRQKLAEVLIRAGDTKAARDEYLDVADRYRNRGFDLKAIGALKVLLSRDPVDIVVNERLADVFTHLGLTGDAVSRLHVLAEAYEAQGELGNAIQKREQIEKLAPQDILNSLQLGESHRNRGAPVESTKVYKQVLSKVGKKTTATLPFVKVAERLLELGHEDVAISRQVAQSLLEDGDLTSALEWLERCQKLAPNDVQTLEIFAELFRRAGHNEEYDGILREIGRLSSSDPVTESPSPTEARLSELSVCVVDNATPPPGTPPPFSPPPRLAESALTPPAPPRIPGQATPPPPPLPPPASKPPPIPTDALSASPSRKISPRRSSTPARAKLPPLPIGTMTPPPHRGPKPPPLPSSAMAALIDEELDQAFSVAFRPMPATPSPSPVPMPKPGDSDLRRRAPTFDREQRSALMPSPNPLPPKPLVGTLDDRDDDFEVRVFDSVVSLPSNVVAAEESCRPSRVAQGVGEAARDDLVYEGEAEVEIDVESFLEFEDLDEPPPVALEGGTVRLDPEVDRLLNGVRTLLEFDIVDKALRIAARALEKAPDDLQVRELHKLAVYRAGRAGQRDAEGGLPRRSRMNRNVNRDGDGHE